MIKNPELINTINTHFDSPDDKEDALLLCTCIELDNILFLYRRGIIKNNIEEKQFFDRFRILFVCEDEDWDGSDRKYKLRYPLFVSGTNITKFDEYVMWLKKNPKLKSISGRFDGLYETRQAFKEVENSIKDFNFERFKACTETFFLREGQYSPKLIKFLEGHAKGEYGAYEKIKSKLI